MDTAQRQLSESARVDSVIRNIWTSFVIIGTIVNLASLTFLFWFRNKPIVAMGQPRLLAVMCVGSLMFVVGHVLRLYDVIQHDEEFYEKLSFTQRLTILIFIYLGDFAVDVILFLKLYRVYKVMRFRRGQTVLPRHIIVPFVVLMLVALVFSILSATRNEYFNVYLWLYVFTVFVVVRVALLVFAWILRNVTESVGDTRRILRYVVFAFIIWSFHWVYQLSALYEYFLEPMEYSDAGLIIAWILVLLPVFLHSVAPATFLVFPRMYLVWYERVHGHLPDHVQVYGGGNIHVNSTPGTGPGAANANANGGNANANVGRTTTTTTMMTTTATATVSRAEASAENQAATTTTTKTIGGIGNENTTVVNIEDGGSSRQTTNDDHDDDDDDDHDDSGAAAAAAVANV